MDEIFLWLVSTRSDEGKEVGIPAGSQSPRHPENVPTLLGKYPHLRALQDGSRTLS